MAQKVRVVDDCQLIWSCVKVGIFDVRHCTILYTGGKFQNVARNDKKMRLGLESLSVRHIEDKKFGSNNAVIIAKNPEYEKVLV